MDPITIKDRGDRQKRLHDHIQLIEGIDGAGNPVMIPIRADGSLNTGAHGAAHLATSEVTSSSSPQTLVVARPTRRTVLVRNDGSGSDAVRVGEATVSASKGVLLTAGQSFSFSFQGLIQVIATSGTPVVTAADEYD